MIYRVPGFLAVARCSSSPSSTVSKLDRRHTERPRKRDMLLKGGGEGGENLGLCKSLNTSQLHCYVSSKSLHGRNCNDMSPCLRLPFCQTSKLSKYEENQNLPKDYDNFIWKMKTYCNKKRKSDHTKRFIWTHILNMKWKKCITLWSFLLSVFLQNTGIDSAQWKTEMVITMNTQGEWGSLWRSHSWPGDGVTHTGEVSSDPCRGRHQPKMPTGERKKVKTAAV